MDIIITEMTAGQAPVKFDFRAEQITLPFIKVPLRIACRPVSETELQSFKQIFIMNLDSE